MDLLHAREQSVPAYPSETGMLAILLERGCSYLREDAYPEAAALLTLALEQVSPAQTPLVEALQAFLQCYQCYHTVHQELQQVSRCFTEAQGELQRHIKTFESSLATLTHPREDVEIALPSEQNQNEHLGHRPDTTLAQKTGSEVGRKEVKQGNDDLSHPVLAITCFGRFTVRCLGKVLTLCSSRTGQGILRYLVSQSGYYASSDVLQTLFWPEDEGEVGQRKLHIAISALRRSLHNGSTAAQGESYILHKNGVYSLNPHVKIVADVDEFMRCYQQGQQRQQERIALYERACQLYRGPFLPEDLYADWSFLRREQLSQAYLGMCRVLAEHYIEYKQYQEAAQWAMAILKENRCDEAAHHLLILIYAAQGQRGEARQQYQRCEMILREELGVQPLPETRRALQLAIGNDI